MLIVPASTACVAGVALGLSKDLLQRVASVTLKERRRLVVAVRETPLNGQTLKHLVTLDEAGAVVLPASPAFYAGATHIQDLVDFVAGRVLDAGRGAAPALPAVGGGARLGLQGGRLALLGGAVAAEAALALSGGGRTVGTRTIGQVLQLAHAGVGHLDRVHGDFSCERSSLIN
ncbi:Flavin prenyltransferase PAD1, mitochondrial [Streptomyces rimosus subsp. rimosus]